MNKNFKIEMIKTKVQEKMTGDSAHDFDHVMRVFNLARIIARSEAAVDMEVLETAALLHDIGSAAESADATGQTDHAEVGAIEAEKILLAMCYQRDKIDHIKDCILSHRHRNNHEPKTIEAKILFDADKLETVGAVGVARAFAWVGKHNAKIYKKADIDAYIQENQGGKINGRIQDKSKHSAQINFETKDKFLLELLFTDTGKLIGHKRLKYYKEFLDRLEREVNGEE